MPEIIVKYSDERTLEALRDFSKYFDYEISFPDSLKNQENNININGVTIIPAESSIDTTDLLEVFTGKNLEASELRNEAWQRKK